ncbi:MAG: hydrolase [Bacteroidales bacterium]|nr:hydrolase [Bacteroidales bacterium]
MRILKEKTIGLIIDIQERIFPVMTDSEKILKSISVLIEGLKILKVPIFFTEQYPKGLGPTIPQIATSLKGVPRYEKASFSCCDEPPIMLDLAASGTENVIIAGIESHVCVLQTAIDLKHNGYHPIVVEDCIASRNPNEKKIALERMQTEGIPITTCEAILFELLRYSNVPEFKQISKLIKENALRIC